MVQSGNLEGYAGALVDLAGNLVAHAGNSAGLAGNLVAHAGNSPPLPGTIEFPPIINYKNTGTMMIPSVFSLTIILQSSASDLDRLKK